MSETVPVKVVDGELVAAEHGPWCSDAQAFPPPPKCESCSVAQWVHDPQRDGAGCTWCGAFAQVDADNLCRDCFADDSDSGRANLTTAATLLAVATIGATFVTGWALQAAAMLGGVG